MTTTMSGLFADGSVIRTAGTAVVYGAGSVGRDVLKVLTAAGIRVRCILDRRAAPGETCAGVSMYPLAACPIERRDREAIPVVIGIFNRDADIPAIGRSLRDAGFAKVVSFIGMHGVFADALGDRFWLTKRDFVDAHRVDIGEAERVFRDERSLAVYRGLIALRQTGEYGEDLNPGTGDMNYLPGDVPNWPARKSVRLVDCGAYRGDTFTELLDAGIKIEASAHFEPDTENFAALARVLREQRADRTEAVAWPCAVSDRTQAVPFSHGLGEASQITPDGSGTTIAIALDDALAGWRPTLIKMDIEGAEIEALLGARASIAAHRPSLAICVYHRPDHLWRIPLLVSTWPELSGYRYYLRAHAFNGFDTVFYANPSEVLS